MKSLPLFICCIAFFCSTFLLGQDPVRITFVDEDRLSFSANFQQLVQQEIVTLLGTQQEIIFNALYSGNDILQIRKNTTQVLNDDTTDIVIGMGLISSLILAQQSTYPKPAIASIIIDKDLEGLSVSPEGGSGVNNFTFVETPFDVKRDLDIFHQLVHYKHLGIMLDSDLNEASTILRTFFERKLPEGSQLSFIPVGTDPSSTIASMPEEIDAVYTLTFSRFSEVDIRSFFDQLHAKGIPSFALTGRPYVNLGAMAGLASESYLSNLARRLALNVMYIIEGTNASELPVKIITQSEDFVINMAAVNQLKVYPDFDLLNQATLLNLEQTPSDIKWSIQSIIYESLKNNLNLLASEKDVQLAQEDVHIAQSDYLPQVDFSSSAAWIDQKRVDASSGRAASVSWTANTELTQLIYSEPALANIAIQKILKENEEAILAEAELDIILETAQAYLTFLQTKSLVRIQNQNVDVTKRNLNISSSKEQLGYSGISDVYRLESQLAQNVIDLNDAFSNMQQARINLNRIINHPQDEIFNTVDVKKNNAISLAGEEYVEKAIKNFRDLKALTNLLIQQAFQNLPELHQIELAIQAQERLLKSNQRRFYTPQIGLNLDWTQPIKYFDKAEVPPGFTGLTTDPQFTIGTQVSLPLFQGGYRKAQVQKSKVSIAQLGDQRTNLKNGLEANLRASMEILSASYQRVDLSERAAIAARKNFDIIQDLYRQGEVDIIRLVDAQNATLSADLSAANAVYRYISDFLAVERSTGHFYFLKTEEEKVAFRQQISELAIKQK